MRISKNRIFKNDELILSLKDWSRLGGPKSEGQWKPGRSAMETARAWLGTREHADRMPEEVVDALEGHDDFRAVQSWQAEPEVRLKFDSFRGEPRNTDLAVGVVDEDGEYFIAVEGKADEPFDLPLDQAYSRALKAKEENVRSNAPARVENLSVAILGKSPVDVAVSDIHYQLLTATAGALSEAKRRNVKRAILFIHEFVSNETIDGKHIKNAHALNVFVAALPGNYQSVEEGSMIGPIQFESADGLNDWSGVDFYVGKARRYLRKEPDREGQTSKQGQV